MAVRRFGPAFIAAAVADILTTPASGFHHVIKQVHIVNKGAASSFSLFLGGTGGEVAGTEIIGGTRAIAANAVINEYPAKLLQKNTEYISGKATDASRLVITIMYDLLPNEG